MVRNDVGRVAVPGSVRVPEMFRVEQYPTVWQMTSTVTCTTHAGIVPILAALFPAASITGAPKARTMEIIAELEERPRQIYTGTIGYLAPGRRALFNVAIRTVLVDRAHDMAEYGVGGGILWDSTDAAELQECAEKARILTARQPEFQLLETLRWTEDGGYFLLDEHLDRLRRSAEYFAFHFDAKATRRKLLAKAAKLGGGAHRVRLLVSRAGIVTIQTAPMGADPKSAAPRRVCLAAGPVDTANAFLYHKTTHRKVYEDALAACPGFDDVILWNAKGEVTESTVANVIVEVDGEQVTPPVSCGLLAGTCRARLLEGGKIREGIVTTERLRRCGHLYLANSVRGQWEVTLAAPPATPTPGMRHGLGDRREKKK
jgi:para-aminobenzoate synthetase / 4-amino-4-deoxychorismate lyase